MPPLNPRQRLYIYRTDGQKCHWPKSIPPEKGADSWDWFEPLDHKDTKTLLYLIGIGQAVGDAYLELARQSMRPHGLTGTKFELAQLPDGYKVFLHHKKKQESKAERVDAYLYGAARGHRFRSVNEFKPHAVALAMDDDGTPWFTIGPFVGDMTPSTMILVANIPPHVGCKLCEQKLVVTPRAVNPRLNGQSISRRPNVMEPAGPFMIKEERTRALNSAAFNLRLGELVWVLDPQTSDQIKVTPSLKPININQRRYLVAMIVGVPPQPITWEHFQNVHPLEGIYDVQVFRENSFNPNTPRLKVHFTNAFPYVYRPPQHLIDVGSDSGALLARTTVSFITAQAYSKTDDIHFDIQYRLPLGYASDGFEGKEFHVPDGIFVGPEKIWEHDVFQFLNSNMFMPEMPNTLFMHISDILLEITKEDRQNLKRVARLKLAGKSFMSAPCIGATRPADSTMPKYFPYQDLSGYETHLAYLNGYMSRYYEIQAVGYWAARHDLSHNSLEVINIVPDRRDVILSDDPRGALLEYREPLTKTGYETEESRSKGKMPVFEEYQQQQQPPEEQEQQEYQQGQQLEDLYYQLLSEADMMPMSEDWPYKRQRNF